MISQTKHSHQKEPPPVGLAHDVSEDIANTIKRRKCWAGLSQTVDLHGGSEQTTVYHKPFPNL